MADPLDERPLYVISIAAELAGMHPQTLRAYDRLGLVSPGRASGRGRRYSEADIARLREVARLSQDEGVNLAGIKRIIQLQAEVDSLRRAVAELETRLAQKQAGDRRDLVPFRRSAEVVVWRPERRR